MSSLEKSHRPSPTEVGQGGKEDNSLPKAATEAVLADVDVAVHKTLAGNGEHLTHEAVVTLHQAIHTCECAPVFDQYVQGQIPTFVRMFGQLPHVLNVAFHDLQSDDPESVVEEVRLLKLIKGRESQIRQCVQQYVSSVVRFNNLRRLSAGGNRDINRQFVDADYVRRRAHNTLIESLSVYRKSVIEANSFGLFKGIETEHPFAVWDIGTDARAIPEDKVVIMSERALENRGFVRDWAIAAYFAGQLQVLEETLREEKR